MNGAEGEPLPDALLAFVERMVRALVDTPAQVRVCEEPGEEPNKPNVVVRVAAGETGQILGKGGVRGEAVRVLAKACARQHGRAILVQLDAPRTKPETIVHEERPN